MKKVMSVKINSKYNKLTVISYNGIYKKSKSWNCICDCGNKCVTITSSLNNGRKKDCGCGKIKRAKELNSLPKYEAAKNRLWSGYKRKAKERNIEFSISRNFFEKITQENCHYCGTEPRCSTEGIMHKRGTNGHIMYNGVDRKDNNIGYIEDNCLPCCSWCNKAKLTNKYSEFINYIKRLARFYNVNNNNN